MKLTHFLTIGPKDDRKTVRAELRDGTFYGADGAAITIKKGVKITKAGCKVRTTKCDPTRDEDDARTALALAKGEIEEGYGDELARLDGDEIVP